jgi:hypothetical protein
LFVEVKMPINNYSRVRLLTSRYDQQGVSAGAIGYIIEVYDQEAYEVEFSDENGITIAQLAVPQREVELADEEDTERS